MEHIERLLAIEEIKNLRIKYAHLLDTNNVNLLSDLFTADAICDAGQGTWQGREAIAEGMRAAFAEYDTANTGLYPFHHVITNHWIEFMSPDSAEGRSYLVDLQTDPARDRWILLGSYVDEYRREGGIWLISRTRLDVTWPHRSIGGGLPDAQLVLPARQL
ncbi:nuclear transport factor 2 family protein [Paenarthrobacter sp. NPDC092416]|uniref:nuclear transport factor 2 family protein n=1 Tax=Paenarthrobacter sp. NPDC092416 TaxID=3364386 RepID=UPI00381E9A4B